MKTWKIFSCANNKKFLIIFSTAIFIMSWKKRIQNKNFHFKTRTEFFFYMFHNIIIFNVAW